MSTPRIGDEFTFSYFDDRHQPLSAETVASPPFLAPAMDRLRALSEPCGPGEVRSYFFDLASKGSFAFISPLTGHMVTSGDSVVLSDRNVVFSCPQEPRLAIAAEFLGAGFPLAAFIDFERNIVYSRGDRVWGFRADHLSAVAAIRPAWTANEARTPPIFVLGEQNYAHCALNQLPAVEITCGREGVGRRHASEQRTNRSIPYQACSTNKASRASASQQYQLESLNQSGTLFIPCGANRVTRTVVQRVLDYARRRASPTARAIARSVPPGAPCLWMSSAATINRTPSNQTDFLSMVGRGFLDRHWSGAQAYLDGLSLPSDFARGIAHPPVYSQEWFESVVARDCAAAEEVYQRLGRLENVHIAVGLSILELNSPGRTCDVQPLPSWQCPTQDRLVSPDTWRGSYQSRFSGIQSCRLGEGPLRSCDQAHQYLPPHLVTDVIQSSSADDPRVAALELHSYTVDAEAAARYITDAGA